MSMGWQTYLGLGIECIGTNSNAYVCGFDVNGCSHVPEFTGGLELNG